MSRSPRFRNFDPGCAKSIRWALSLVVAGAPAGAGASVRAPDSPEERSARTQTVENAVRAVEMRSSADGTVVRLRADRRLDPASVVRAADLFTVSFETEDLSPVAGSVELDTPEVRTVTLAESPGGGGVLELVLDAGAVCDFGRREDGLEVWCKSPPETPGPEEEPEGGREESSGEGRGSSGADSSGDGAGRNAEPGASGETVVRIPESGPYREVAAPFSGERVSLDFRDADLRDVLRVLSEVSGLDFVLQPGVSGRVSLRLTETPWDQALEVILRSQGLGHVLEGGVLRVGLLADLLAERRDRQIHREQSALTGELVTLHRRLAYVRPEEVREVLESRLSERGSLILDQRTGIAVIRDVAVRAQEIGDILAALDIPVPGVEIEARIVLATRTLAERLGIRWSTGPDTAEAGDSGEDGQLPPRRARATVEVPMSSEPTGALGIALGAIRGVARVDLALAAAERRGEVRILSAPRIVAQNGRPATIKQGVTFPVQVVANNTVTVQFQDAVLELTVTPQVSPAGTVLLELLVSNDSLDFGQAVNGIPSILTQNATTRVRVEDGATTVLGGVFAARESTESGRVPGLHRIPLLGHLFRSREQTRRDEELLIFLTPTIRSPELPVHGLPEGSSGPPNGGRPGP